jgi:hypothetical protein
VKAMAVQKNKLLKLLLLAVLLCNCFNTVTANTVTVSTNRTMSYLLANNVGGSGSGGKLDPTDNIIVGNNLAILGSTTTLTIDANATCNSIELGNSSLSLGLLIGSNGVMTFSGNFTLTVTTDVALGSTTTGLSYVTGAINMAAGGTLLCRVIGTFNGSANDVGSFTPGTGTIQISGTFLLSHANYATYNNLIINATTSTTLGAPTVATTTINGYLIISAGVLNSNGGDMVVLGNWTNNASATGFTQGTRKVTFNGTTTVGGTFSTNFYDITINATKTLIGTSGSPFIRVQHNWVNNGIFTHGSGTVEFFGTNVMTGTVTNTTFNNLTIFSGGTLTPGNGSGATLNIIGDFTNNGTFTHNNSLINFNGTAAQALTGTTTPTTFYNLTVNKASGTLTQSIATVAVTNLLTMTAGIYDVQTNTLNGAAGLTATGGDLQLAKLTTLPELVGTYSITGGTVTFKGAGAQTVKGGTYYNTVFTGASGTKTLNAALVNNNDLTISSASLLDVTASNYGITIVGNWINNSSVATAFVANSGTVTFNGNTTVSGTGTTTFYKATINATKTLVGHATNMIIKNDFTNNGTFTHNSGKVTFNGPTATSGRVLGSSITSFYDLSVGTTVGYTLVAHPTEMQIAHNFDVNTSSFDSNYPAGTGGDGLITFNGTSAITLTASVDFNHIKIAPASSLTAPSTTSFRVFGDWDNNGTFIHNSQLINFRSQTATAGTDAAPTGATRRAQAIKGTAVTTFYNLAYNNADAAASLTLQQSIIVANQLDLRAGPLVVNKQTLTIQNGLPSGAGLDQATGGIIRKGATTSTLGAGTGYIVSEDASLTGGKANNSSYVTWGINANTGIHVFPFGNAAGAYIPFTFNLTSGNTGNVTISTYATNAANIPYPIGVIHVFDTTKTGTDDAANVVDRFWNVSSTSSGISTLTFAYADTEAPANGEIGSDGAGLRAQQWNAGNTWLPSASGQTANAAANTVIIPNVSTLASNKPWALALHIRPLPIELVCFNVIKDVDKSAKIVWKTATETNNKEFIVQRSHNGLDFENLIPLVGAGNSLVPIYYNTIDKSPLSGTSYYRLLQNDFDGKHSYSNIVLFENDNKIANLQVYPNPVQSNANVSFNAEASKEYTFTIYDAIGKLVLQQKIAAAEGENSINIDMSNFESGLYYYSMINNTSPQDKVSGKLIKQ